jgi:hypothetical protein
MRERERKDEIKIFCSIKVNGRRLLGLNHVEVVTILKDLPMHVRIVCARRPGQPPPSRPIDTAQDRNAFAARVFKKKTIYRIYIYAKV